MSTFTKSMIVGGALLFVAMSASPANNAEEVVFSTPGFTMQLVGNSKAAETPFGFWIWCAASAAPGSNGGYQRANACQGSMYFYALDTHVTPVIGFVTEGPDGIYTMNIFQGTFAQLKSGTLNPDYTCLLTNTTPDPKGPGNGVDVSCAFLNPSLGGGTGFADGTHGSSPVTNATVNVTGP
jgi:hypothetical protein